MKAEDIPAWDKAFPALVRRCTDTHLPHASWEYEPLYPHFGKKLCAYCGEPRHTIDAITNLQWSMGRFNGEQRRFWLVDACQGCHNHLRECNERTFGKRGFWLFTLLAKRLEKHRGRPGMMKAVLTRRVRYMERTFTR